MAENGLVVRQLVIYPVKSCRKIELKRMELDLLGPKSDRRFMLIRSDGTFVSQRETPILATFDVQIVDEETLLIGKEGRSPLHVSSAQKSGRRDVEVHGEPAVGDDLGDEAAAWWSEALGFETRLVSTVEQSPRSVPAEYSPRPDSATGFADAFPVLICTDASAAEVSQRIGREFPMERYRPNIVISGGDAWDEDTWKVIRIGTLTFDLPKTCSRCVMITTDQISGAREPDAEPLRTLATYRKDQRGRIIFGQNAVHRTPGAIQVGDDVEVLERR